MLEHGKNRETVAGCRLLLLLIVFLCLPRVGFAFEQLSFDRLTVSDGLSQGVVQAIVQDGSGFYWIGTQQGLNRYDGYDFRTFFKEPNNPNSLQGDWIWDLHVDRHGDVWIAAESGGVSRYNRNTQAFDRFPFESPVREINEDEQGLLWLATEGSGVVRLNPISGSQQIFAAGNGRVKAIHIDADGTIWAGTDGTGLFNLVAGAQEFGLVDEIPTGERVRNIVSADETLWVGTYENGLFRLDLLTSEIAHHTNEPGRENLVPTNSFRALLLGADGSLWIGNEAAGLTRFDGESFATFKYDPSNMRSLSGDYVSALYEDQQGLLWVGTHTGISVLNRSASIFKNFNQLSNTWISGFAEDKTPVVWVATMGGGINKVNLSTGVIETVLDGERVTALLTQTTGQKWAGTRASGLHRYEPDTGLWHAYRHDPNNAESLSFDGVTSLLEDTSGRIWVGTYLGGLNRYNPSNDSFTHYRHATGEESGLCPGRVLTIHEDPSGALWLGMQNGGLCRFEPVNESFKSFRAEPDRIDGLASDDVTALTEDHQGNLWIGTADAGVSVWLYADKVAGHPRFLQFNTSNGLASDAVYGTVVDDDGSVWVSGNRGITRVAFDAEMSTFQDVRRLGKDDGLPGFEFNLSAALRMRSGYLLFGGTAGFTVFDPALILPDQPVSNLVITSFATMNAELPLTQIQEGVVLEHTDKLITLEYSTMNFGAARTSQYMHKLDGFDLDWVEDGPRRHLTYTNLAPGEYTFRVRVKNADGVVAPVEIALPIQVLPAPWASAWAYTLYTFAILLMIAFTWRSWRIRSAKALELRETHEALLGEVKEREAQERLLATEQRRAQQYLDIVEVIVLALDDDARVTLVNQRGARVFGCDESELIGAHFFNDLIPPDQAPTAKKLLKDVDQYTYCEFYIRDKAGEDKLVAWHIARVPDGLLMSGTDVTQMRALEKELHNSQKLEALGTLSRGVAHDFNNILSAILGYAELSQADIDKDNPAHGYQEKIAASVERAREIIKGILTFGQVTRGVPRALDLSKTVAEALQLVHPVLPANVSLQEELDDSGDLILADAAHVIQVVLNLCTNAVQSIGQEHGSVTVSTAPIDLDIDESRSLLLAAPGRHMMISVADTGPGMDKQTQARAFEPYFTTRSPGEGSGLGLSVVHGIVTQLNGAIRLDSTVGQGTRFDIFIPRFEGVIDPEPEEREVTEKVAGECTVLLVDDEEDIIRTITALLEYAGYKVISASSGEAAADIIANTDIDILITDQTMRGMRGQDVAAMAKQANPALPILLMSGAVRPSTEHIDGFIGKPFTRHQLLLEIQELLGHKLATHSD